MYVSVQVPEEELASVYELLLTRLVVPTTSSSPVPTLAEDYAQPSANDDTAGESEVFRASNDAAQDVCVSLARRQGTRFTLEELRAESGVDNIGAAMQSIAIQCRKLGLPSPVEKRRDSRTNRVRYSMRPEVAARILKLAGEEGDARG